ncbi:MAG: gliding motility-associated C-terminal domain-containing protein [Chitinophagaceae bacterium]|nr:gliding motility-associated C-terminal domain-containing protein [Chitinophagaceae bacterium]
MKSIFGGLFKGMVMMLTLVLTSTKIHAQLCQGSLGDPLVNITFGSGSNPGPALTAATTSYQYISGDCPNDGAYTVRSNTVSCFGNTWHTLNTDHTGDPNGYFMLVNASFQASAFYIDTVKGLCGGTTYEFAAWIINVLRPSSCNNAGIQPNLTFTLERTDGTVLRTYNTNNIPSLASPAWQQFGFFFTTPTNVSDVVLRIFNNSLGGCGNDLALDDITFRPCGPRLTPAIAGNTSTDLTVCEDTARSFTFDAVVSAGFNNPLYQWQQSINGGLWTDIPGATNTSWTQSLSASTAPGIYSYRLSAAEAGNMAASKCRVVSQPLTITIAANPQTTITSNAPLCENNTLTLSATGGTEYQWTGVNNFVATGPSVSINNAQPAQSGKYYLNVTNTAGCSHADSTTVVVNAGPVATISFTDARICEGETVALSAGGGGNYQWIPSTGLSSSQSATPSASPLDTTLYKVVVINPDGCTDTASVIINVIEAPRANAGPDQMIIKGNSVQLPANVSGQNISFVWSPTVFMDDPQLMQPTVTPPADTSYTLTVTSNEGCGSATDDVKVYVYKDIYIPTAFSPNGNGLNDTWFIPALSAYSDYSVRVYNRYGQILFQSTNANKAWDGRFNGVPQPSGVYVYVIDLRQSGKILKGTLAIIR